MEGRYISSNLINLIPLRFLRSIFSSVFISFKVILFIFNFFVVIFCLRKENKKDK